MATWTYQFKFLTPKDYNQFFQKLRGNDLDGFRSKLEVALSKVKASSSSLHLPHKSLAATGCLSRCCKATLNVLEQAEALSAEWTVA